MNWSETKKVVRDGIAEWACSKGFVGVNGALNWVREYPELVHIIAAEKMTGDHLRVRCFITTKNDLALGDDLTRHSVGATVDGDYFWSIASAKRVKDSLSDLILTLDSIALPWFSSFGSESKVREAQVLQRHNVNRMASLISAKARTADALTCEEINILPWELGQFSRVVDERIQDALIARGLVRVENTPFFQRKREKIFDVIQLIPGSHEVHLFVKAFNWVTELSGEPGGKLSEDNAYALNGGICNQQGNWEERAEPFLVSELVQDDTSAKKCIVSIGSALERLSEVSSETDFAQSITGAQETMTATYLGILKS